MFRLNKPSSGKIQNTVLVHSVSAYILGSHTVHKIILTLKIIFILLVDVFKVYIYIYI
jgi:hypothetical protein